ncbi:DUF3958 family protein [Enterococcus rivorum]|uniref:Uncharacterized protein n=1 Tax=Enterococcus rivorum TaxID=762845 RepID=A0A1E5KTL4_9ENTE|nr:DUF3958 family protein [Enterococcus rivorum]MBP2100769.1 uncharacterized protein (UPF0335 family) [Enterococcus rivorum]OEH81098.1 hypothetical protein BCR26_17740 [Enterococcus rivorum]
MIEKSIDTEEAAIHTQLKQVFLDQEVKMREIRKHEDKINDVLALGSMEQTFFSDSLGLQLDDQTQDFFHQSTEESRWLSREELDYLEEKSEHLEKEKRQLLEEEEQLLRKRKELFSKERSQPQWD